MCVHVFYLYLLCFTVEYIYIYNLNHFRYDIGTNTEKTRNDIEKGSPSKKHGKTALSAQTLKQIREVDETSALIFKSEK